MDQKPLLYLLRHQLMSYSTPQQASIISRSFPSTLQERKPPIGARLLSDGESIEEFFNNNIAEFMRNFDTNINPCLTVKWSKTVQVDQSTKTLESLSLGDDLLGARPKKRNKLKYVQTGRRQFVNSSRKTQT